ncbi:hypothetical protein AB4876_09270 [Zhongshania guokunii]|uniref:ParB-like nuclease domain-containing protein n=1 Tax=Zhongshania guokunii TaxID=641783 RepID=A0ABV3U6M2_9GAMM
MTIKHFVNHKEQMSQLGKHKWHVPRLIELAKDLEVMDIPLEHMNMYYKYENLTLREMVGHMKAVNDADLKYPIIIDEDGEIMDGRHRLMKAILEGESSIKAVRFKENPSPCEVAD